MELALLRRGGQPRNQNALTHGLYSARSPHPVHAARLRVKQAIKLLPLSSRRRQILSIQENLAHLRDVLRLSSETGLLAPTPRAFISHDRGFQRAWTKTLRASETLRKRLDEINHLPRLASRARSLYTWEFKDRGIGRADVRSASATSEPWGSDGPTIGLPPEPEFIPLSYAQADPEASPPLQMYSPRSAPEGIGEGVRGVGSDVSFLTSSQCLLLQPLLTSLRDQISDWTGRESKSRYADVYLLDLILLKLAFGLTWSDLPPDLPVRSARRLYRQLYLSGRMAAIYTLLHRHLDDHGSRSLDGIAESDALEIQGRLVVPTMTEDLTWEVRTALLLLQRALFNERKQQRQETLERHSRGLFLRQGILHLLPPHIPSSKIPAADPDPSSDLDPGTWILEPLTFVPLTLGKNDKFPRPPTPSEADSGPPVRRCSDGQGRAYHPLGGAGRRPIGRGLTPILSSLGLKPDT